MRIGIEASSVLGPRSGVGLTTAELAEALVAVDDDVEVRLLALSVRGAGTQRRIASDHPRITLVRTHVPARLARTMWGRVGWPPAELFCGAVDVFHGPNLSLPPLLKAAGVLGVPDLSFLKMPELCSEHVRAYVSTVPEAAARANRLITWSQTMAEQIADWLPGEADRIRVVYPGVRRVFAEPGGPLTPPRKATLGIRDPYVVHVGTLEMRKNLDVLLQAFATAHRKHPDLQLVLIGAPGTGWDGIADHHADLLDSDAVVVCGYLPDGEVAALVRGAIGFVYPSHYEGFGMPPLEALAAGTPVIASTAGALPEVLDEHARYVDPQDAEGFATALLELLDGGPDPGAAYAGRVWASAFTWERTARETLAVYREALEEATT